jgi:hypothetical protein
VSATGRAAVAWGSQFLSEGGSVGVVRYQAAIRPARAKHFLPAQLLERQSASQRAEGVALAFDAAGRALFAWTGFDGTNYRARVATAAGSVFGAPETLSPPGIDAIVDDLATGSNGDALVVWEQHPSLDAEPGQIFAALRPAQDAFGPPEAVSALEQARVAHAAFDPRTGRPTVVWSNRPGPSGPGTPIADIKTYAQAATRLG